jgi:hypothetical protein
MGLSLALSAPALAVRPFVTDDARVVGGRQAQAESWVRGDRSLFEHWFLAAYGPIEPLELTIGMVHGVEFLPQREYTAAGPLLQAKYLLRRPKSNSWPGLAVSAGAIAPAGFGPLRPEAWQRFVYAAVTESLGEGDAVLLHGNVGAAGGRVTWGAGTQTRVKGGFHFVGEIFSGDPYAETTGNMVQLGFRHFFSEYIQIDGTIGTGVTGQPRASTWATIGIRLATPPLGRSHRRKS